MVTVTAVCLSEAKGVRKHAVECLELVEDFGAKGDAHAGSGRQVSLLALEDVDGMRVKLPTLGPGDFAENLLVAGLGSLSLAIGDRIRVGDAVLLEITQIGKECHSDCEIRRIVGKCVMPTKGLFAKVVQGGVVRPGDELTVQSG
jgi:MOSC domain-containing protein YiiM